MKPKNDLFRAALLQAEIRAFSRLSPDPAWVPSPGYLRRVGQLTRRVRNPFWKFVNTAGKRAAVIIIALLLSFSLLMTVKAIRDPLSQFIISVFRTYTDIELKLDVKENAPKELLVYYEPTYVPEGYSFFTIENDDFSHQIYYDNAEGRALLFDQFIASTASQIDTEGTALGLTSVSGKEAYYSINKGICNLIWTDGNYLFSIYYNFPPETMPLDEVIKMAESIRPEENKPE